MRESQKRAIYNYKAKHLKTYTFNFIRGVDDEVINLLDNSQNKKELVKQALLAFKRK